MSRAPLDKKGLDAFISKLVGEDTTVEGFFFKMSMERFSRSWSEQDADERARRFHYVLVLSVELTEILKTTIQATAWCEAVIEEVIGGDLRRISSSIELLDGSAFRGQDDGWEEKYEPIFRKFVELSKQAQIVLGASAPKKEFSLARFIVKLSEIAPEMFKNNTDPTVSMEPALRAEVEARMSRAFARMKTSIGEQHDRRERRRRIHYVRLLCAEMSSLKEDGPEWVACRAVVEAVIVGDLELIQQRLGSDPTFQDLTRQKLLGNPRGLNASDLAVLIRFTALAEESHLSAQAIAKSDPEAPE